MRVRKMHHGSSHTGKKSTHLFVALEGIGGDFELSLVPVRLHRHLQRLVVSSGSDVAFTRVDPFASP